jgi:protein O-GlcNAc transferase
MTRFVALSEDVAAALELQRTGQAKDAAERYAQILCLRSGDPEIAHLLGLARAQANDLIGALAAFNAAICLCPQDHQVTRNAALVGWRSGDVRRAVAGLSRTLALRSGPAALHVELGLALRHSVDEQRGRRALRRGLALEPARSDALVGLKEIAGDPDGVRYLVRALAVAIDADVLTSAGLAATGKGEIPIAARRFRQALVVAPDILRAMGNLATLVARQGWQEAAFRLIRRGVALAPADPACLSAYGVALAERGRADAAVDVLRSVVEKRPEHVASITNLGMAQISARSMERALSTFLAALRLDEMSVPALSGFARCLRDLGRLGEAATAYRRALAAGPSAALAHNNFGNLLVTVGRPWEATRSFRRAVALAPEDHVAHSNLLFSLSYDPYASEAAMFAEYRRWAVRHADRVPRFEHSRRHPDSSSRRLRIGYLSADLREHPIAFLIENLLSCHDRSAVEAVCYAEVERGDTVTTRLRRASSGWRTTVGLSDREVADLIYTDKIDILVVLAGHTAGNRMRVCAFRPAPVQVNMHNLSTSGIAAVDYWFTDAYLHPVDTPELASETLWRLPNLYLHRPPEEAPAPGEPPCLTAGRTTFGAMCSPAKINQQVIALWAQILDAVPGARLALGYQSVFGEAAVAADFRERFRARGIPANRLDLWSGTLERSEHLARLNDIDVALDPFPFNGGTGTFEALWMGVPVVTLAGRRFAARGGMAHLSHVGLGELVATDGRRYVAAAVGLAGNVSRLRELRRELRGRVAASPLCDARAYASAVEAAYRAMWRAWNEGHEVGAVQG